ncbi:hypothetical protein G5B00_03565 [Parapedobacter sp. SGR-10]|uniref:hypothetical protein n=1 Tax=Parapedobacter sp. SGR-10 TaxID=2710879 RepID=UPI0013D214D3|nr:hypothetical protein [Parapedobacter sp. SGR-10]NGF55581.1 hypothetical protein [Parapedobacter sp. SGR-10]
MDNRIPVNRVETALNGWRSREERFSRLFSFDLSSNRALMKEKLSYYDRIATTYKGTRDMDERLALKLLRQERNHMEKRLYPHIMVRLLRRLVVVPIRERIAVKQDSLRMEENRQALDRQVQRAGFTGLSEKIGENMNQGQQQFSIPVSRYINEKERLDYRLSFVKDHSGTYRFDGYKADLHNENRPDEKRQQYFGMENGRGVNTTEAYNLLSGRSVQKEGRWLQLDFNDRDALGNFRVKEFHAGYGYNIDQVLQQLPLKELLNQGEADRLRDALKHGERQSVTFTKDGHERRYYIEANPQHKSVNVYDEHSRKITLNTALGNKTMEAVRVAQKESERQQQGQAKRNGMRVM